MKARTRSLLTAIAIILVLVTCAVGLVIGLTDPGLPRQFWSYLQIGNGMTVQEVDAILGSNYDSYLTDDGGRMNYYFFPRYDIVVTFEPSTDGKLRVAGKQWEQTGE